MHQGEKVAIIAAGSFYQKGENVVRLLADKGIDATLINPRYLNEVDAEVLDSLKANHQLVVTLEDGSKDGGFGERIASYYGTSDMKAGSMPRMRRLLQRRRLRGHTISFRPCRAATRWS